MPTIDTLIRDIHVLLDDPNTDLELEVTRAAELGSSMVRHVIDEIKDPDRSSRDPNEVYVTQLTSNCDRRVWFEVFNKTADKERVPGSKRFKFVYGDLLEEMVLYFAEIAGHTVSHRQHRLEVDLENGFKIAGRIDAVIDECIVDVKSMDHWSFEKMKKGEWEDKFGYGYQLYAYADMWQHNFNERDIRRTYILGINKMNGELHLHNVDEAMKRMCFVEHAREMLNSPADLEAYPIWETTTLSGNGVLDTMCSYCPYKFACFEQAGGLEVYAYSNGPKFLIKGELKKEPKVPNITEAYKKEVGLWPEK